MVEIEAAQEILVGFAFARMLGDDQAGTASSISPGRSIGRVLSVSPERAAGRRVGRLGLEDSRRGDGDGGKDNGRASGPG